MRIPQPEKSELEERRLRLKAELVGAEEKMTLARSQNDLTKYEDAKTLHDVIADEINAIRCKLHPYAPHILFDKYGDIISLDELKETS